MDKSAFIQQLMQKKLFWSYAQDSSMHFPDQLVIEQVLLLGDVDDLKLLFSLYSPDEIRSVWEQQLVPQQRYHKLNFYLGKIFFRIHDIESFLSEKNNAHPRLDRLRVLAAEYESRID